MLTGCKRGDSRRAASAIRCAYWGVEEESLEKGPKNRASSHRIRFEYIEVFDIRRRAHSRRGYESPVSFEHRESNFDTPKSPSAIQLKSLGLGPPKPRGGAPEPALSGRGGGQASDNPTASIGEVIEGRARRLSDRHPNRARKPRFPPQFRSNERGPRGTGRLHGGARRSSRSEHKIRYRVPCLWNQGARRGSEPMHFSSRSRRARQGVRR